MVIPAQGISQPESVRIRIVVYDKEEQLYQLREEWDALLKKIPTAGIYLTWEWALACWRVFGRDCQLFLLAAYDGDKLVGLAPLRSTLKSGKLINTYTVLELIPGSPLILGADHLDIIAIAEKRPLIIGAMAKSILALSWDMLRWVSIPASSPNMVFLAEAFHSEKITLRIKPISICPYITLTDNWEEFLELRCSARFRKAIRYAIRRLESDYSVSLIRMDSPQDFLAGLKSLEFLHEERWGEMNLFRQAGFRAFHEEISQTFSLRGWLRIYLLIVDGKEVAVNYGFRYGSTFFGYQAGWKKGWGNHSVGNVLLAKVIQRELIEGAREIDLARGDEEYKFHWAHDSREDVQLIAYRRSWQARLLHFSAFLSNQRDRLLQLGSSMVSSKR
jgi:hypothetical protein